MVQATDKKLRPVSIVCDVKNRVFLPKEERKAFTAPIGTVRKMAEYPGSVLLVRSHDEEGHHDSKGRHD